MHPPAIRLERAIRDLHGLEPDGAPDDPPVARSRTLGRSPSARRGCGRRQAAPAPYAFLPVEGESLHQIPVGPVHAGIIEPGHFRFTANGETVVRLEERLGYVHKGIDGLMRGADLARAARLAGRTSGDSTVAYALAFARAVEAALGIEAPPRAHHLRALMAELERLANHFGDIGAICNDATFPLMLAQCGILRERVLRAADLCFGHRLMMDRIVPGGVAADLSPERRRRRFARSSPRRGAASRGWSSSTTTPPRCRTAPSATGMLERSACEPVRRRRLCRPRLRPRASTRAARPAIRPMTRSISSSRSGDEGDVNARVWVRIKEVTESLSLIEQAARPAAGRAVIAVEARPKTARAGEGAALVEGFRGDILAWVRLGADLTVERCHLRDPSWFQWPLLEAVIEGNIVADFPLCNKSFNCSYSGHDL